MYTDSNFNIFSSMYDSEGSVNGYVEDVSDHILFPVQRVLQINTIRNEGRYFFRLKDMILLLDVEKPSKFIAEYRKFNGKKSIYKGICTNNSRTAGDNAKTSYIEAEDLLEFLKSHNQKCNTDIQKQTIAELEKIIS